MSHEHEQKHLLHNWSDCCYRDRPQTPPVVLKSAFLVRGPGRDYQGAGHLTPENQQKCSVADVQQGLKLMIIFPYFKRLKR
jgi:hypothetical protein